MDVVKSLDEDVACDVLSCACYVGDGLLNSSKKYEVV